LNSKTGSSNFPRIGEDHLSRLFRKEAISYRSERLHGDINLAIPVGWQLLGYCFLAALVAVAIFLFSARYAKIESVSGILLPDKGLAAAVPTRPGVLTELLVKEGSKVQAGTPLARIRSDEVMANGAAATTQMAVAIGNQDAELADQSAAFVAASNIESNRLHGQAEGLLAELQSIDAQIAAQVRLVGSARDEIEKSRSVAQRGFISRRDMLYREELLMTRQQQLAQLQQGATAKRAQFMDVRIAAAQAQAQVKSQVSGVRVNRAELSQRLLSSDATGGYVLAAPVAGVATAITAKVGQPVGPNGAILSIIPSGSHLRAELSVPVRAIGFLRTGQGVGLAIDAFAYQQFGSVKARITSISTAPISQQDEAGKTLPVYPVIAEVEATGITAFGKTQPLVAGMTLTARITTRRQTLIEWLFEPLFAAGRR
jgi:membrane fusion protein